MKRKIIVGNWKMNPVSLAEAQNIFKKIKRTASLLRSTQVVMCPPFVFLGKFAPQKGVRGKGAVGIGAQDVFYESQGAFTGNVSAAMLKDLGLSHVIVGHSERRAMGETDEVVSKKALAALEAGIHPIICVGEVTRDAQSMYLETLKNQIRNSLSKIPKKLLNQIIVAYEPVWAIGAKEAMDPATIEEMTIFVKKVISDISDRDSGISTPVLYGGSINFRNAPDIMVRGKVDGLLVGRESVNTPGFVELLKAVDPLKL
jgi:triosephosphate isomerase (TIM)